MYGLALLNGNLLKDIRFIFSDLLRDDEDVPTKFPTNLLKIGQTEIGSRLQQVDEILQATFCVTSFHCNL